MPPKSNLVGQRFGALTVIAHAGRNQRCSVWLVQCDCGAEETYPQHRLTERGRRDAVDACKSCRARPCVVCGEPTVGTRATCSTTCRLQHTRTTQRDSYHRRAADPEKGPALKAARKMRYEMEVQTLGYEEMRRAWREQHRRRAAAESEDEAERRRARQRAYYAANAEAIQAARRRRLDEMSPEQLERWMERTRAVQREYQKRWREDLARNPERHRRHLDMMAEYRRRRRLLALLSEAAALKGRDDEQ